MNTVVTPVAHVNGVLLAQPPEALLTEELRQRACAELLRQAAMRAGLLAGLGALASVATSKVAALIWRRAFGEDPPE